MIEFKLILITGEPGSGKTTLSRTFSNNGFRVVHTSAIFKMALLRQLIPNPKNGNSFAPTEADDFIISSIRQMVRKAVRDYQDCLVVETFPRTLEQFNRIEELIPPDIGKVEIKPCLISLHADELTRCDRMQDRPELRREFDEKRGYKDFGYEQMYEHLIELGSEKKLPYEHFIYNTEQNTPSEIAFQIGESLELNIDQLSGMINSAVNGYYERSGYIGPINCNKMLDRIIEECEELREEIARSGTSSAASHSEFADILHFVFCLSDGLGLDSWGFLDCFHKKTEINQARLHFGVTPENKHKIVDGNLLRKPES